MKNLVELIAKAIVDNPDQVKVQEVNGDQTQIIELSVAQDDMGKVIGKKGARINAIRTVLGAASKKQGKRYNLNLHK